MSRTPGRKRRFISYGALNVVLTNLALQAFLLVFSIGWATFLSQALNTGLGFVLYGKAVFRVEKLVWRAALRYLLLALCLWALNWAGITLLGWAGMARHLAALALVPVLASLSYAAQKLVVFRQPAPPAVLE